MKTFKHFPKEQECMICKKNDDLECVLIGDDSTIDGNIMQAKPVHLKCLNLWSKKEDNEHYTIIYQIIR